MSQNAEKMVLDIIQQVAGSSNPPEEINSEIFKLLGLLRAGKVGRRIAEKYGTSVLAGPFQGMVFPLMGPLGCYTPKLLGVYEMEIHGIVREMLARSYRTILNIGCAEGYYAVGMALKTPGVEVFAHDISEAAQDICRGLARHNKVENRVHVGGLFEGAQFAAFEKKDALVFCDIEGVEKELLDPTAFPALKNMDVFVESHDCFLPGMREELSRRFTPTHHITWIEPQLRWGRFQIPEIDDDLDMVLASYENRDGPTPWGYFKKK